MDTLFPPQPVGYVERLCLGHRRRVGRAKMEDLIQRLRAATGAEIAVVTLPSIGDQDPAEVALAIGRKWKVGAKAEIGDPRRNAGLVLLLVPAAEGDPNSGQIRIEVGQGLEGIVTDAAAGQVRDLMRPELARRTVRPRAPAGSAGARQPHRTGLRRLRFDAHRVSASGRLEAGTPSRAATSCRPASSSCSC